MLLQIERLRMPFRWVGSKMNLMRQLRECLPAHNTYISMFGGGAGDIIAKSPSKNEIYNDVDPLLFGFWAVLKSRKDELLARLTGIPYSRGELYRSVDVLRRGSTDPVELAVAFLVTYNQSLPQSACHWETRYPTWTDNHYKSGEPQRQRWAKIGQTIAAIYRRFHKVETLNMDWRRLLPKDREDVLWFVDPPYLLGPNNERLYRKMLSPADHLELAFALRKLRGRVILCGYAMPLYDRLLPGWHRYGWSRPQHCNSYHGRCGKVTEHLWTNFPWNPAPEFLTSLGR